MRDCIRYPVSLKLYLHLPGASRSRVHAIIRPLFGSNWTDVGEMFQHQVLQSLDLLGEGANFDLGFYIRFIFDVIAHLFPRSLPILTDKHEQREENRLERHNHCQQPEREWIEWLHSRNQICVQDDPNGKPESAKVDKANIPCQKGKNI